MTLPRLHLVTDDDVLRAPGFAAAAAAVFDRCTADVALHLRGHATAGRVLYDLGETLAAAALRAGGWLFVNDRIDVAMAVRANGVQLGRRSLPIADARLLLGRGAHIGWSAHDDGDVARAAADGADFVVLGTIYASASHAGAAPAGVASVAQAASIATVPIVAIGGITPARAAEVMAAGAYGAAVLGGVWHESDPAAAAAAYVAAMKAQTEAATSSDRGDAS
jgi:thiamine-phosphate diphosphorylase